MSQGSSVSSAAARSSLADVGEARAADEEWRQPLGRARCKCRIRQVGPRIPCFVGGAQERHALPQLGLSLAPGQAMHAARRDALGKNDGARQMGGYPTRLAPQHDRAEAPGFARPERRRRRVEGLCSRPRRCDLPQYAGLRSHRCARPAECAERRLRRPARRPRDSRMQPADRLDRASPRAHWPIGSVRRVRRPWQCAPDKRAQAAPRAKARMSRPCVVAGRQSLAHCAASRRMVIARSDLSRRYVATRADKSVSLPPRLRSISTAAISAALLRGA